MCKLTSEAEFELNVDFSKSGFLFTAFLLFAEPTNYYQKMARTKNRPKYDTNQFFGGDNYCFLMKVECVNTDRTVEATITAKS